jgi:hypothetical protein
VIIIVINVPVITSYARTYIFCDIIFITVEATFCMYCVLTVCDCHFESSVENGDSSSGCGVTEIKVGHKNELANVCNITFLACSVSNMKIHSVVHELLHAD